MQTPGVCPPPLPQNVPLSNTNNDDSPPTGFQTYFLTVLNGPNHILTAFGYFDLGNVFAAKSSMDRCAGCTAFGVGNSGNPPSSSASLIFY